MINFLTTQPCNLFRGLFKDQNNHDTKLTPTSSNAPTYHTIDMRTTTPQHRLGNQHKEQSIHACTHNLLEWTAIQVNRLENIEKDEKRRKKNLVTLHILNGAHITATQESTRDNARYFKERGVIQIDADNYAIYDRDYTPNNYNMFPARTLYQQTNRAAEQSKPDSKTRSTPSKFLSYCRNLLPFSHPNILKWYGLNINIRPDIYAIHPKHPPRIKTYSKENQAHFSSAFLHTFNTLGDILELPIHGLVKSYQLFTGMNATQDPEPPVKSSSKVDNRPNYRKAYHALFGGCRVDGLLIAHLIDKRTNEEVIVCNTHLESYNPIIREGQRDEMIEELKILKKEHPNVPILLMGDMNRPQRPKIIDNIEYDDMCQVLNQELNAHTLSDEEMQETYKDHGAIDCVYFIPPTDCSRFTISGRVLEPCSPTEKGKYVSDHAAVDTTIHLYRSNSSTTTHPATDDLL